MFIGRCLSRLAKKSRGLVPIHSSLSTLALVIEGEITKRTFGLSKIGVIALIAAISSPVSSSGASAPSNVGTISLQAGIVNTAEGNKASAELQTQFASPQNCRTCGDRARTFRQSCSRASRCWSDEERGRQRHEAERRTRTCSAKAAILARRLECSQSRMS